MGLVYAPRKRSTCVCGIGQLTRNWKPETGNQLLVWWTATTPSYSRMSHSSTSLKKKQTTGLMVRNQSPPLKKGDSPVIGDIVTGVARTCVPYAKEQQTVRLLDVASTFSSGQGRIRTSVGRSQQIYSLPRLTTSVPAPFS